MATKSGLTFKQIKAARALLDWSQEDLAEASGLSCATIRKLELGNISPRDETNIALRKAFEDAGLEFIEPNGVRQRPEGITIYEGDEGARAFFDDVYETTIKTGQDVVQVWTNADLVFKLLGDYKKVHDDRMTAARGRVVVRGIVTGSFSQPPALFCEGRFLSRQFVDSVPFYVYGDKYAIIPVVTDTDKKIIVIESRAAAIAFRAQFNSMWEKAMPIDNITGEIKQSSGT